MYAELSLVAQPIIQHLGEARVSRVQDHSPLQRLLNQPGLHETLSKKHQQQQQRFFWAAFL